MTSSDFSGSAAFSFFARNVGRTDDLTDVPGDYWGDESVEAVGWLMAEYNRIRVESNCKPVEVLHTYSVQDTIVRPHVTVFCYVNPGSQFFAEYERPLLNRLAVAYGFDSKVLASF